MDLSGLFSSAPADRVAAIAAEAQAQKSVGKIDTPERLAHFFGQVRQEAGPRARLTENLNYRASVLPLLFSYFRHSPEEAERFGRTTGHPADQEAIANRAYANRIGNGDVASGDGWRFRGRGLKQLTGRSNYRAFTQDYSELFGPGLDFEREPDRLAEPVFAVRSALFFWVRHKLYEIADRGISEDVADDITEVINKHTDSYEERWENVRRLHDSGVFR